MFRATSSESGIHSSSMDCSQARRDDVIGPIARSSFEFEIFFGPAARITFLRIIKCGDSGISTAGHKSYYSRAWEFTQFVQCRLQLAAKAHVRRSIQTDFPMTTLTDRELEVLIGLRTNWRELYSKELTRLLTDDTKRAVDRLRMPCDPALLKTQRGTHIFDDPD